MGEKERAWQRDKGQGCSRVGIRLETGLLVLHFFFLLSFAPIPSSTPSGHPFAIYLSVILSSSPSLDLLSWRVGMVQLGRGALLDRTHTDGLPLTPAEGAA